MRSEEEHVRDIMADQESARRAGEKLGVDLESKTLRVFRENDPDNPVLVVTPSDMKQFTITTGDAS